MLLLLMIKSLSFELEILTHQLSIPVYASGWLELVLAVAARGGGSDTVGGASEIWSFSFDLKGALVFVGLC